ncbi:acyl-CoA synthetase [Shimia sp.]|uniref:acyl-CoA synthetase n=1 Tax=Shimia sp. TaxID=1954381 RepID=UPI003BAA51CB
MNQSHAIQTGFANLADIESFEQTPLNSHDLPATTYDALKRGAALNPAAPAISFFVSGKDYDKPKTLTHGELLAKVTQTANALRKLGVGSNDVVAYVLPNLPETHMVIWGGSAAGRVLAINPLLEADQIAELLKAANTKVLVTLEKTPRTDLWEKCRAAVLMVPSIQHIVTCSVFGWMDGAAASVFRALGKSRPSKLRIFKRPIPVTRFEDLIKGARSDDLEFEAPKASDTSTMLCTGGTTGLPKIAPRTHASEVYDAWALAQFNPEISSPGVSVLCGLPLFHSNAILVTGLLVLMSGGNVVLATPQGYRGDGVFPNFWKIVDHYKIVTFSGVPTVYSALLDVPRDGLDISSVKFGACGAAPMPVELFNNFVEQTGIPIVEGYGLTEGAVASSLNPTHPDGGARIGSIGLRLPHQKMRCAVLADDDSFERWAEIDEVGVILISGPNVFDGYLVESQNKGLFFEIEGERWMSTGDLARQDAEGYFWMTGRKKELIIRGGHNIDPKIIEEAMHMHPGITMAAAIGRPDAKVGELPVLYYQGEELSTAELAEFAASNVAERAAIPKDFIRLEELPVTGVGKIHKPSLMMMEIERVIRAEAAAKNLDIAELELTQDNQRGIVAKLRMVNSTDEMRHVLGLYAFNVDYED